MSYSDLVIADGASNYWRLNETSGLTAVDAIGGKNGTISGGVTLNQPGVGGRPAMTFNGTTGKIVTAASVPLPVVCTVELWVKTILAQVGALRAAFSTRVTGNTGDTAYVGLINQAAVACFYPTSGIKLINDGQWHQLVFVVNGTTDVIYVDGQMDRSAAHARTTPSAGPAWIGNDQEFDSPWPGSLQDIAIYPLALTAAQVRAHYLASFPAYQQKVIADGASVYWPLDDASGTTAREVVGGKHGTISGGVTLNQSGVDGTTAMTFNGTTGKIVTAGTVAFPLSYTVEAWVKYAGLGSATQRPVVTLGPSQAEALYLEANHQAIFCNPNAASGSATLTIGQWYQLVWALEGGATISYYVNGAFDRTTTLVRAAPETNVLSIGHDPAFGPANEMGFLIGSLQDVAIYPRALTPAEITAHYKSRVTLSQYQSRVLADGASAYWPLDEVAGTVARDLTAGAKHGTISGGVTLNQPGAGGGTAMTFNGTTGKIVTAANVSIPLVCTIEVWAKTNVQPTDGDYWMLCSTRGSGTGDAIYFTVYSDASQMRLQLGSVVTASSLHDITDNLWHHVVVVLNAPSVGFYVDGVFINTSGQARTLPNQGLLTIGQDALINRWWLGSLQDIAIYPRALTPAEIATHYQTRLVPPVTSTDLTTAFAGYLKTLRAANPGKDLTTLVMKDLPNVRAAAPDELDDINTMYDDYLGGD